MIMPKMLVFLSFLLSITFSISSIFTFSIISLNIIFDNEEVKAVKEQNFTIKVSTKDLDVKKTTSLYTRLVIEVNGKQEDIRVNFSISW